MYVFYKKINFFDFLLAFSFNTGDNIKKEKERMIFLEAILNFDLTIFKFFQDYIYQDWLTPIMKFVTDIGEGGIIFIVTGLILMCFKKTRKAGVVALGSLLIMSILNNEILKPIMNRPRPFNLVTNDQTGLFGLIDWNIDNLKELKQAWVDTYRFPWVVDEPHSLSFPSGHTSSAFAFVAGAAFVLKKWQFSVPAFVFAALMGITRIYVAVHYPTDVIAGAVAGILYAVIGYFVVGKLYEVVYPKIEKKLADRKEAKKAKAK